MLLAYSRIQVHADCMLEKLKYNKLAAIKNHNNRQTSSTGKRVKQCSILIYISKLKDFVVH